MRGAKIAWMGLASMALVVGTAGATEVGTRESGYALGSRNGGILVERLRDRTVGTYGCRQLDEFQDALVKVASRVRAPRGRDKAFAKAFYRGYLDAIRDAVESSRSDCRRRAFDSGAFVGELYGSFLCSLASADISLLTEFELPSLFMGWSGGSREVVDSCQASLDLTVSACTGDLEISVRSGCDD